MGRDDITCIASRYRAGWSRDRVPVKGRFSAPNLLQNGYRVSFSGVKRPGCGADHPHPHLAPKLKKECSYTSTALWAFVAW